MQVAILAGGLSTRLRPLTEKIPKSMVKIHGRPFLEYQLDFLRKQGIKDIVLCIGYLGEQIQEYFKNGERFGVKIQYSNEGERLLDTAGALKNAESLLENEFFVMYGDSYLFLDFNAAISYFHRFSKLALMTVYRNYNRYDKSNAAIEGNLVKIYNKRAKTEDMIYIDYGASILKKEVLDIVPQNAPYSLEKLFSKLVSRKEVLAFEVKKRFYEIGSKEGLVEFQKFISKQGSEGHDYNQNTGESFPWGWGN